MKKFLVRGFAVGCMLVSFLGGSASAATIDFEGLNYTNVNTIQIGDVTLKDSMGSGLTVSNYYESNYSRALAVFGDDASRLQLSFDNYYNFLSFDFGNDNPGFGSPNGKMHLDLYNDGILTGAFSITANWDDKMNQNLAGNGLFNYAEIYYDSNLIEVIDNLVYLNNSEPEPVPEPATMFLVGSGLLGFAVRRKNRKK